MESRAEHHPKMKEFIAAVDAIVTDGGDETLITEQVARLLRDLLKVEGVVSAELMQPSPDKYVLYPIHVDPDGRFSIASAVWNVGQVTPVHDHGTWGVIGIVQGAEYEIHYAQPSSEEPQPLVRRGMNYLVKGDVTVCCTSHQDVHEVRCASDIPCVGIHVYGADIGTIQRHVYDPDTGKRRTVVTSWDRIPAGV